MISKNTFLRLTLAILLAGIAATAFYFVRIAPQSSTKGGSDASETRSHPAEAPDTQTAEQDDSETSEWESKLSIGKPVSQAGYVNLPLHFRAGRGESVGRFRAEVTPPESGWKLLKMVPAPGSKFEISAKQEFAVRGEPVELHVSGGSDPIPDGFIGMLKFSVPHPEAPRTKQPATRILQTSPPDTSRAGSSPDGQPSVKQQSGIEVESRPDSGSANPAMGCFFFSH